jgi:gliding motility-associated lipoprotein GldH
MKKVKSHVLWIGLLLVLFSACDRNQVFDDFRTIPNSGWHKDSLMFFDFKVADTKSNNNLFLKIRNSVNYEYSNVWLFIEILQPDGRSVKDTFEITLADPTGKWLGEGISDLKTRETVYRRNVYFPVSGNYQVKIQQGMRQENLTGIHDIGFRIEKLE